MRISKLIGRLFVMMAVLMNGASGAAVADTVSQARVAGTAWYVDNAATGGNDGTSWSNAWQSFAAINWSSIQPGDTIYISGGSGGKTYLEQLKVDASGAPGTPITIRVGQEAGHNGQVIISNRTVTTTSPYGIGIYIRGRSYIIVDGNYGGTQRIRVTECADAGVEVYGSHHITLTYLEIDNNGDGAAAWRDNGVYANIGAQTETPFLEVSHSKIHDNWQDQLNVSAARLERHGQFLIHHNEIYNLSDDGIQGGAGIDYYNNVMHSMAAVQKGSGHPDGLQFLGGYGRIYNNVFYNLYHPTYDVNAYIYYEMYSSETPVQERGVRIYNNLIYHTQPMTTTLRGITFSARRNVTAVSDVVIANNTIVGTPFTGLILAFADDATGQTPAVDDVYVLNNILYNLPTRPGGKGALAFGVGDYTVGSYGSGADVTFDYNILNAGPEGGTYVSFKGNWWTYDQFKTNTGCQAHITGNPDPLLMGNYCLAPNSPARDAGVDLSAYFTTDHVGITRPQGVGWDIGAFEFTPSLTLHGAPADRAIHLTWQVNTTLPVTTTWRVEYYTRTATLYTATNPLSTTRSLSLTQNVYNYQWYTVTLHAMLGSTSFLSDTVRVMPTDRFVYLPLVTRDR